MSALANLALAGSAAPQSCNRRFTKAASMVVMPAAAPRAPLLHRRAGAGAPARSRGAVCVMAFSLLRNLGVPKPRWLPDLDKPRRGAVLDAFFAISDGGPPLDRQAFEALLAPDFRFVDQPRAAGSAPRTHFRADFVELMCGCVAPAIPDFSWGAATDGEVDKDGYAIVEVQVSGHHSGQPLALPGLPPLAPSGRRVALEREFLRVRVEGGRVKEIVVLPSASGAGPVALYTALGGQLPPEAPTA